MRRGEFLGQGGNSRGAPYVDSRRGLLLHGGLHRRKREASRLEKKNILGSPGGKPETCHALLSYKKKAVPWCSWKKKDREKSLVREAKPSLRNSSWKEKSSLPISKKGGPWGRKGETAFPSALKEDVRREQTGAVSQTTSG